MNFGSAHAFLSRKSWHSSSRRTILNVWSTEHMTDPKQREAVEQKLEEEMKGDTNVFLLSLASIGSEKCQIMTGDPTWCSHCGAAVNTHSKLDKERAEWTCEFCEHRNQVAIEDEEIPRSESVDYFLKPPSLVKKESVAPFLIFCLDISGSMGTNVSVNSYKNRLQVLQEAIISQIRSLAETSPSHRVALIAFNNTVTIYGDGLEKPKNIYCTDARQSQLIRIGKEFPSPGRLEDSHRFLFRAVGSLEDRGSTALGPALLIALGMAQGAPSSQIVVATDGLANSGVGSIEVNSESELENVETFYANLGDMANRQGTSVSILSIPGTDCNIEILGRLAVQTSGKVDIVDLSTITESVQSVVSNTILARDARFKLILPPALYLKSEEIKIIPLENDKKENNEKMEIEGRGAGVFEKSVGNVTTESEVSFEYGVFPEVEEGSSLPVQVQITYTLPDGSQCLRIVTKSLSVTTDQEKAEKESDTRVMGLNFLKQGAAKAANSRYADSEKYLKSNSSFIENLWKKSKTADVKDLHVIQSKSTLLQEGLGKEKQKEAQRFQTYQSRDDRNRGRERARSRSRSPRKRRRSRSRSNSPTYRKMRARDRNDAFANVIAHGLQCNFQQFQRK